MPQRRRARGWHGGTPPLTRSRQPPEGFGGCLLSIGEEAGGLHRALPTLAIEAVSFTVCSANRSTSRTVLALPPDIEEHRDRCWRRDESLRVDTVEDAERFIDRVGFAACLTDARRPGPSLYVAVCGRRDAVMPRHVQKDEEASLTWTLKDEILTRGRVCAQAGARPGDVRRAADDSALSRGLGRAPIRGRLAPEPTGPARS